MKTKLLFFAMFLIGLMSFSQNTYVPDDNFEQVLIDLGYDSGSLDDYVPTANINTITDLDVAFRFINDLTGIEDFIALNSLDCSSNSLLSLDVSNNTALMDLSCWSNQLSSLDVSQNTSLITLTCNSNSFTSLDVSNNYALTGLYCSSNNLSSLNLGGITSLEYLNCGYNSLSSLDLGYLTALISLHCEYNNLSNLDVSNNTALISLYCYSNAITSLDVSNNTALTHLYCYNNNLSVLDVHNNTNLTNLLCRYNNLSSLDVSNNTTLTYLICSNNSLNNLNVKNGNNTNFTNFQAQSNSSLTCINVDDAAWSTTNWTYIDAQTSFSEDCGYLATEDFELAGFSMYPNPIYDVINISINEEATYSIFNINGRILKEGKLSNGDNEINISHLSDGLYLLNIRTDRGFINKKLMKM